MKLPSYVSKLYRDIDGWWIELAPGWRIPGEAHGVVAPTRREALESARDRVPCDCDECESLRHI